MSTRFVPKKAPKPSEYLRQILEDADKLKRSLKYEAAGEAATPEVWICAIRDTCTKYLIERAKGRGR